MKILENTLERQIRSKKLKQALYKLKQDLITIVDNCVRYEKDLSDLTLEIHVERSSIFIAQTKEVVYLPTDGYPHDVLISQYLTFEQVKVYLQALMDKRLEVL